MELSLPRGPGQPQPVPAGIYRARRAGVLARLGDGVAVVGAAPELVVSRDTDVPYRPDADLYYLTAFEEPRAAAVLTPHHPEHRFVLFVRPRDSEREAWSGPRAGVERAGELCGADAVYPIEELEERLFELAQPARRILYPLGHAVLEPMVLRTLKRARPSRQRSGTGPVASGDLDIILGEMRRVKDDVEVGRLRTAAAISAEGHLAAMRAARPGVGEWELQAVLEATFRAMGAAGPAFPSIVGAGANGTYLHYVANRSRAEEGDLVLIDAGAEWGMYCGDITRTFPVSGRFTAPQRELYELVLAAEEAGISAARPGGTVQEVHRTVLRELVPGLMRLGLLPDGEVEEAIREGAHRRFYMHQSSHWLGLDVHDAGSYADGPDPVALRAGMVFTIEPGLYVASDAEGVPEAYRGIGIRIEDDVLITEEGREVLTRAVPVSVAEIEEAVGRGTLRDPAARSIL